MDNKVLIIEDDKDICELIQLALAGKNNTKIHTAEDIGSARALISQYQFEVILLDLNLKTESGYELMRYIDTAYTKILIVTAKNTELDVYKGFEQGAVDYIKKPFDPMELAYRVNVHLDRARIYEYGHLRINSNAAEVFVNGQPVRLTSREYDLLLFFIHNRNQILTKEQLYDKVWGYHRVTDDNTLMVHMRTLRKKIEMDPDHPALIVTIRGKGYIFKGQDHE
ncbi:response regulator transcription factor [Salinicoccus cyprini]|uniref:Response regulator transcription factor n=1 Tax=Salinicoccus cyprini TaxID=2493691 RepID=A0A558AUZ9_9STAP|nr:response regulator transcription factor [Salinicoccus cyprini]TVT28092.1 response regulator transcription factor [Salinicoccus cyprini]